MAMTPMADGLFVWALAAVFVAFTGWTVARFFLRRLELFRLPDQGGTMQQHTARVTDFDSRRLQSVIAGSHSAHPRDVGNIESLERRLDDAEVVPADRIGPDVVTMNSEVRIHDLDKDETIVLRLVFPSFADAAAGRISVLAPLGMAILGCRKGETVSWRTPGGLRSLRVDEILFQPEREGSDLGARGSRRS
jgi:regulator of nucleoside diphosphate kinase